MFPKNRNKIRNILIAILPALFMAGFWGFANLEPKTSITAPVQDSLVGYWNMDSNDIYGSTLYDKSGQGNHGTIYGATATTGKIKQALSFDGVDDRVSVPDSPFWQLGGGTGGFTIELWAELATLSQGNWWTSAFVAQDEGGGAKNKWIFSWNKGTDRLTFHVNVPSPPPNFVITSNVFGAVISTWYYITLVRSGDVYTFYKDGVAIGSVTQAGTIPNAATPLTIGWGEGTGGFNGLIDEVRIYNRALSAAEILQNYNASKRTYIDTSLKDRWKDGLVLLQTFDGPDMDWGTSTAEARDRSGQGNHGDVIGGAVSAPGKVGQALSFDGVDDYVDCGKDASLNSTDAITVEAWVNLASLDRGMIVGKGWSATQRSYYLDNLGGKVDFCIRNSADTSQINLQGTTVLVTGKWYHMVGTWNGSVIKVYLNGVEENSASWNSMGTSVDKAVRIGWMENVTGLLFKGLIDEVRIYNRALSAEEIKEHYQAGLRKTQPAAQPLP